MRRLYLNYQKMTFTDTGELGKALISYIKEGQVRDNQNSSMSSDTIMEIETDVTERYRSYVMIFRYSTGLLRIDMIFLPYSSSEPLKNI